MASVPTPDLMGLRYLESRTLPGISVQQHDYRFTEEATAATVRALLNCITSNRDLTFFDARHPQRSDPGAYVTLVCSSHGLLAQLGNHGWSTRWSPLLEDDAARYLRLCVGFNAEPRGERLCLTEPSNWRNRGEVDPSPEAEVRRYLRELLENGA